MARLGFNVVRLGMTWSGLEPGTAPANDPAICGHGQANEPGSVQPGGPRPLRRAPHQDGRSAGALPHLHDPRHAPGRVQPDVRRRGRAALGRVHQQRPERRPARPLVARIRAPRPPASPSTTSGTTTCGATCRASTTRCGATSRARSDGNRWVLGYDPFNEPFSTSLIRVGDEHFDSQLECFYTGTAHIGTPSHGAPPLRCPPTTRPTASSPPSWPTTPATSSSTSRTTTPAAACPPTSGRWTCPTSSSTSTSTAAPAAR